GRRRVCGPRLREALAAGRATRAVWSATVADDRVGMPADSAVPISIPDAIEGFYLGKIRIDAFELLAEPLDVAVDRSVVDLNVLPIGRVHQLVAVFDVPRTVSERFEDQELGHRELYRLAVPGAQMACRIEDQTPTHDDRLALGIVAFTGKLATPDQRT